MAEQGRRSKVEFAVNTPEVVELLYDSFAGEGEGTYGPWWRWSVYWKDMDATLFTDAELQELIVCAEPKPNLSLQIVKQQAPGSKRTYWRVYKPVDGEWAEVLAGRKEPYVVPDKPQAAARPQAPARPPAPPAPPPAPTAAPPVPPAPAGPLTVDVAEAVMVDCYAAAQRVLYGGPLGENADIVLIEQARAMATTLFIAAVDGCRKTPPGYDATTRLLTPPDQPSDPTPREPGDPGPDDDSLPF